MVSTLVFNPIFHCNREKIKKRGTQLSDPRLINSFLKFSYLASQPPSTTKTSPLTKSDSSEAK